MEQRKSKIEYEKPRLIVLKGTVGRTEGTCAPGSGDSGNCYEGTKLTQFVQQELDLRVALLEVLMRPAILRVHFLLLK